MITTVDGLRYGQLVQSKNGRDRESYYVIVGFLGEHYVWISDGDKHPVTRPKKKNLKHLRVTMAVAQEIEAAQEQGGNISDTQIFAAMNRMKNQLEEGDRVHG